MSEDRRSYGGWDEFTDRVKRAYGELTDDDYLDAGGSRDKLIGIIEQRFGEAKEKIIEKLNTLQLADKER